MNYNETLSYIHSLLVFGSVPGLERMRLVMEKLGNVQKKLKFIHIAGTNGKGSTATMLSNVYKNAGYRTGLYISPYVVDFRERIQLNGAAISKDELVRFSEQVKSTGVTVTEFEFITAVAFLFFAANNCDVVILETGLGGRLDATNIIDVPLCCVITHIALDHMQVLGDTIEKIAFEKCGIIKPGVPVVTDAAQDGHALTVIQSRAAQLIMPDLSKLKIISGDESGNTFIYKNETYHTSLIGRHQINNALMVIETVLAAGLTVDCKTLIDSIADTRFAARLEIIRESPLIVLDGAHNPDGAQALSAFMCRYHGDITAIIGMMADKDCDESLAATLPHCRSVITVTVNENKRAASAVQLCKIAKKYCEDSITAADYDEAISAALQKSAGQPIFVFGSLYLASAIRNKLLKI